MTDIPIVIGPSGMIPQTPAQLNAALLEAVGAGDPNYTVNLPGILIEDVSSTLTGGTVQCQSALVELVNSLTPYGANAFLLTQLGAMLGVPLGQQSNTSVFLVFSAPASPGYVIPVGFTVSDGTYQYVVQDGGIIGVSGSTLPLFALATATGSWAVPEGSVTEPVTSVPTGINLTVTNPSPGTPGSGSETQASYRARVLQAEVANAQGTSTLLRTLLAEVPGVQSRLISILQAQAASGWEIICGGGDPYQTVYAIFRAMGPAINQIVGSTLEVVTISNGNPGVVTTNLNHGYTTGQPVVIQGVVGMTGINGVPFTATVINETQFSIGLNTTGSGTYLAGGVVTPNLRNITASVNDYPDVYPITYVNPPQETVVISVLWNTTADNVVSNAAVAGLAAQPLVDYVNSITVGQAMNLFVLQQTFAEAVAPILPTPLLTRMVFAVQINGVTVPPEPGTGVIPGDPESFFFTTLGNIVIAQG